MMPTESNLTTCTACGCTCDDIRLEMRDGRVARANKACEIGEAFFTTPVAEGDVALIDGSSSTLEDAIDRAAAILAAAHLPLVTGFKQATTEAIRAAVELADQTGGCVDWTTTPSDASATLALQTVGAVTSTLGEIAQRADVVLLWGSDLATTHPRHFERYSLEPHSEWLPNGRADRTLIVVDDQRTTSMEMADLAIEIQSTGHYEALTSLRACTAGQASSGNCVELQELANRMSAARYGAVVYGARLAATGPETLAQLTQWMADLTAHTRCVAVSEGGPGNATGAANVLTWQTGFPLGVNFAKGYPEYGPDEWTTEAVLARGEVDAALIVTDDLATLLTDRAAAHLENIPTISLDWRDTPTSRQAAVSFRVARPGVETGGTTYRCDGIALPLRAASKTDRPSAETILQEIRNRAVPSTPTS
ncbi:MAG: formylmethanofuran dehydrogenase subunit B [Aeoliella sp.]